MGSVYDLSFGMLFLYMLCTIECCNRLGHIPISRDSRVNPTLCNTSPMREY